MVSAVIDGANLTLRAETATAYHVHIGRLVAGREDEPSEDAEAGAMIAAREAHEDVLHRARVVALVEALARPGGNA